MRRFDVRQDGALAGATLAEVATAGLDAWFWPEAPELCEPQPTARIAEKATIPPVREFRAISAARAIGAIPSYESGPSYPNHNLYDAALRGLVVRNFPGALSSQPTCSSIVLTPDQFMDTLGAYQDKDRLVLSHFTDEFAVERIGQAAREARG